MTKEEKKGPIISVDTTYDDNRPGDQTIINQGWLIASALVAWAFKTFTCLLIDHIKVGFQTDEKNSANIIFCFHLTLRPVPENNETIRLTVEWNPLQEALRYWDDDPLPIQLEGYFTDAAETIRGLVFIIRQKLISQARKKQLGLVHLHTLIERIAATL